MAEEEVGAEAVGAEAQGVAPAAQQQARIVQLQDRGQIHPGKVQAAEVQGVAPAEMAVPADPEVQVGPGGPEAQEVRGAVAPAHTNL